MPTMTEKRKKPGRPRDPESKRSSGADRHTEPRVVVQMEEELVDALENYRDSLPHKPGRSQIIRDLLRDALRSKGHFPPPKKAKE